MRGRGVGGVLDPKFAQCIGKVYTQIPVHIAEGSPMKRNLFWRERIFHEATPSGNKMY